MRIEVANQAEYDEWVASQDARAVMLEAEHGVWIAGNEVSLGRVRMDFPAVVAERGTPTGEAPGSSTDGVDLFLRSASDEPARMTLVRPCPGQGSA